MAKLKGLKRFKKAFFYLFLSSGLVATLWLIVTVPFLNKIYPNIYLANIYVGNSTKDEAIKILSEKAKLPEKIVLNLNGTKNEILVSEVTSGINYLKSIERAFNFRSISLLYKPVNLNLNVNIDEKRLLESILIISEKAGNKPVYPSVKLINGAVVVDPGKNGIEVDIEKLRSKIGIGISNLENNEINVDLKEIKTKLTESETLKYKLKAEELVGIKIDLKFESETITLNDNDLISFLTPSGFSDELIKNKILEVSRKLNRSPQDSVFIVEDGKVKEFTPSKDGIVVDEDLLLSQIKSLPTEINIPVIKTSPKINNKDINNLGIDKLLGAGFSNFKGSIPNRIHNVNLAQSKFKGVLIPPNEILSFNDVIGDISSYTGYKSAYVIMAGKTVLGDGGGVCQVSTTLFRAVLDAGLPIVERRAHAYRVGYYEQGFGPGLDATVYSPTTDFKFKNDTSAYLLLQPTIDLENLSLKFEIYGTDDGRVATTSKPIITSSSAPAEDLYQDDPTLPAGTVKQIEHRAYGARVVFDYKVTRNGETLIDQKFVSNYRPWQAVYLRGTAQ